MGDDVKLIIHYGGSMRKKKRDYEYIRQLGWSSVKWKLSELTWEKFEDFILNDAQINTQISLIWFKEVGKEMDVLDYLPGDTTPLLWAAKAASEFDVFIEHECSEHIPESSPILTNYYLPSRQGEDDIAGGYEGGGEDEEERENNAYSDEDDVDRPKEDEEPEQSEDEITNEENVAKRQFDGVAENEGERQCDGVTENEAENEGDLSENEAVNNAATNVENAENNAGDEILVDAGDGHSDDRFKEVFEEGKRVRADKEAYCNNQEKENAEREEEESEEEYGIGQKEYPDTPVSSDEEWEEWANPRRRRQPQFHGDLDKEPYLWLFQKFNSGLEFKDQLLRYSLKTQFDVKMAKSEANRIAVICCGEDCPFRVYCSYEKPINKWMVKVCKLRHTHQKSSRVSMLKQGVIAGLFREELRRNVNLQASEIKDSIKERYNIIAPMSKCYRGRRIALDSIIEAHSTQFGKLWDYESELRRSNEGIITELNTIKVNDVDMFDCFFICFEELRNSWKNNCRPVIGLDGCFLKWELNGDLLSAVGRDADNRMYPIAWAVVRGENKDTWGWFVKKIKQHLGLGNGENMTIISDRQKGLVIAIEAELPNAEHRMCARHIYGNWRKQGFTRSEFKTLFWGVAYSYTEGEYEEKLKQLKDYDQAAFEALMAPDPEKWCRAFFSLESHCADVHNNLSESFNRTIKIARSKPVINLLENVRRQAMRRISRRSLKSEKCDTIVTPITMTLLEKARQAKKYCSTNKSSSSVYEVVEFECGYTVNLSTHQCACRKWDLTGIPCKHAVCVLDDNQEDPVKYVAEYYYTHVLKNTYKDNIKPVNGEKLWKKVNKPPVGIPEVRKPRGRPKTRDRIKEPFEDLQNAGKATRHGRIPHCSRCGQAGHINRGCKNEPVIIEGPKNKRGRPRKHPDEVKPKPPPNPRKRQAASTSSQPNPRKRTASSSSTQPNPRKGTASATSSQPEVTSSAPQPSASSSQPPKPHAKKAPRGKPLKIRKTGNIPHGVGTYWSPFTDRPFEVFGNRFYDRSTSNPPPPEN